MENTSISIPATLTQCSVEELVIRPLTSADIQSVRALHVCPGPHVIPFSLPTNDTIFPQAELAPSFPALRPTFFHQLLTHQTHLCLVATLPPSSDSPAPIVGCIAAALHVQTSDLTSRVHLPPPLEVHVLALGVLPAFRRRGLATQLLRTAADSLRALAATAPQVPTALLTPQSPTRVCANVARADGNARAFWNHVGMREEEGTTPREPWTVGWRDIVSVAGPVLSAA
jgi:GNAT superfamily N-acetyltransferase